MRLLGAVLAGGASRRFGSDKALALHQGRRLIDHIIAALAPQVEALVIIGRDHCGYHRVDDRPAPGLGPLGGLCGALAHAATHGFDAVLCAPCDTLGLPADLAARLAPGPAHARDQPVIGLWPTALAPALDAWLESGGRAFRGWAESCGAQAIDIGPCFNINTPGDLATRCGLDAI